MIDHSKPSTTVLFNGDCEICSKEICIYQSYGASEGLPIDFKDINIKFVGRSASSTTATGNANKHLAQQKEILEKILK